MTTPRHRCRANVALLQVCTLAVVATSAACVGDIVSGQGDDDELPAHDFTQGTEGNDVTTWWPDVSEPGADNTKMLTWEMLRGEVQRAMGRSWVVDGQDQWDGARTVLGVADFLTTFVEDRQPGQAKIVTIRRMAFEVCGAVVAAESGAPTRAIFDRVDPASGMAVDDAQVTAQIESLFLRVYRAPPSEVDLDEARQLLAALALQTAPTDAWRGLCAGYLSSLRFLSY